jgi:hypothetical protein
MGDLLRKEDPESRPEDAVVKLLERSRSKKRVSRPAWEEAVMGWIVEGALKRGALMSLISAEVLRDVGFMAQEVCSTP